MLKHARTLLAELDDAKLELSELQGLKQGEIHIGASAMLSTYLLSQQCRRPFDPPIPLEMALGGNKNHYFSKASRAFLEFVGLSASSSL